MQNVKIDEVVNLIQYAGGTVIGRTRLQKIAYLLRVTGLNDHFDFSYKHYGPYSEQLADSAKFGKLIGSLEEEQKNTSWGGTYSIYTVNLETKNQPDVRYELASIAARVEAVELELAATAVFLFNDGYSNNAWEETIRRKPEKSTEIRIQNAKSFLLELSEINVPNPLPQDLFH